MTEKAAAVGFDWRKPVDVMDKMREEMDELEAELDADDGVVDDRVRAEMGDVLFVMANLARHLGVEPETALQQTNATFMRRFQAMEDRARETGRDFRRWSSRSRMPCGTRSRPRAGRTPEVSSQALKSLPSVESAAQPTAPKNAAKISPHR